jgi:hypothetical protein
MAYTIFLIYGDVNLLGTKALLDVSMEVSL